jgi:Ca2+-binding EF-hand superfamily protein
MMEAMYACIFYTQSSYQNNYIVYYIGVLWVCSCFQSGMPLSNADIDELIVIFDQNGSGKLNYRDLALSLKLWRLEKREMKKQRRRKVLTETDENGM